MPHLKDLSGVRRVYLIGIGGTAMASLAGMLQQRGYEVAGSDEHVYPPMSTYLEQLGIPVLEGYTKQHLETFRPDLVVIGNAAANTNVEAAATVELDLPYTSMPEAIYHLFIKGKHSIVVAGTHGKTTTTSLMAWLLEAAGRDPSMVVGGIPLNFNQNFKLGDGAGLRHRRRRVQHRLLRQGTEVPALPREHVSAEQHRVRSRRHLPDLDAIIEAFRKAVRQVAPGDVIVANGDDANVAAARRGAARWVTFGWNR
jgi:UDP-N-acetylmuramate: L-alanyl-gamma-D-glutamyl-meso-diaminopimelate ligase